MPRKKKENNLIFVQIASYRDPELVPTIKDCIAKAKYPERLTFGICWQHSEEDEWDNLDEFKNNSNFTILDVPWNESKGLCWARHTIQKLWKGEKYTLQIDSHHRFIENWDEELIEMMRLTGSEKPIITSYAGMYKPEENKLLNADPYKMVGKKFTPGGTILFYPESIPDYKTLDKPIPARFVSGHFFFTYGIHCEEYKYDPNIYFAGDEISLSIRSYTLGYDLFHPHKLLIWHEYTREGRTKHWTDFDNKNKKEGKVDKLWWEMDNESKRRLRHMLQEENYSDIDLGEYGLGTVRTHKDYENYAGINFKNKKLHPNTIKGINPPVNDYSNWYENEELEYIYKLEIPFTENFRFIYVGIEDENGNVLYRYDMTEYSSTLDVKFKSFNKPSRWIYWPVDLEGNWINRKDINI
jgi:hypothetical protein